MVDTRKTKKQKVIDRLRQAQEAAELGKIVAPPRVDAIIDRGTAAIEAAQDGISLFQRFKSIFRKEK